MATRASPGLKSSEESLDYTCSVCYRKGRVREAVKYCQFCQKYLCTNCLENHNEYMEDHVLVDPTDNTKVVMPTDNCERHVTKKIEMWCKGHNEALCTICAFMDHRSCPDVIDISADIGNVFRDDDLRKVEAALKTAKEQITIRKTNEDKGKENASLKRNEYLGIVEEHQRKLISMIEALGKASIEKINNWYTDVKNELEDNLSSLDRIEKNILSCLNELQAITDNKAQLFLAMKKGEKLTDKAETWISTKNVQKKRFQMKFGIERYLSNFQSLGSIQSLAPRLFTVKEKKEINVKTANDKGTCDIESTCVLSDGSILMSDQCNKKLKRLDSSTYTVTDHCDLPEIPRAVCCVGQQEVAVSLKSKKIQLVSVGKTMARTRSFELNHLCEGIAYCDGDLFVNDGVGKVHVYNLSGASLRTLNSLPTYDRAGYIKHIAIEGERLYVACYDNGFQCTDIHGKEIYRYKGSKGSNHVGVSADGCGGVFLSGCDTPNVVQLGADGKELGEVLTQQDCLINPQSVCYEPSMQRLIVTTYTSNNIIMYSLV